MDQTILFKGDCLTESEKIKSGSVDLILTDPPYGNMKGAQLDGWKNGKTDWDNAIDPAKLLEIANRVLRKNGKLILFSQEPYTSQLITNAPANLPFCYRMVWEKDHFANALVAKKAPVSYFEDILVFSKREETELNHPLRDYFQEQRRLIASVSYKNINEKCFGTASNGGGMASNILTSYKKGWSFPTEEKYNKLSKMGICLKPYKELKEIHDFYEGKTPSVFNLWEGKKYKSNILKYKKDYDGYHPTQKPVALLEDLIKTYSNENNLVLDFTMGSGSTGVACVNTNRRFIGIELDDNYFEIATNRINNEQKSLF